MSSLINAARAGARTRVPRFAEAAVERARLTVVPQRPALGRTQAARTPFAVLVIAMLAGGVVGLLMFNTNMQQSSFTATALQNHVSELTAKEQLLDLELDELRDPQHLATAAKHLGMVAPSQPAFIRLSDGQVLGDPTPTTPDDAVRINGLPKEQPDAIKRKTVIVKLTPAQLQAEQLAQQRAQEQVQKLAQRPGQQGASTTSAADTPGTSTTATGRDGRKKATTTSADSGAAH
jgi:outer membrane biosynthesis protein TonB